MAKNIFYPKNARADDERDDPLLRQMAIDAQQALESDYQKIRATTKAETCGGIKRSKLETNRRARAIWDIRERNQHSSFTVFKDASGAYRWVARTTTAYRDRDGEIITTKALERDAQRLTETKQYGPLRYWHIGQPDPFDPLAPWGNGLDLGECDYSIVIGRTSIESGTFKSHAIGKAFAEHASDYELSPGFFHPPDQPNAAGEYDNIRRFERSVVPIKYGRASNLFTGLTVKEHAALDITYKRSRSAAEQKAMFAKMGSGGKGGGGGGGGLWAKGAGGKRVPPGDNDAVPVKPRSVEVTAALLSKTNPIRRLTTEQETSLHYYQSAGHEAINNTLRGNAANESQRHATERTIAALDPMMRKAVLKDNIEAHRGMMIMDQAGHAALARMQPGATLRERGYLSTSINPDVPKRFGAGGASYPGDVSVSMQVRVRAGTRAVYVPAVRKRSGANSEQELLVDRGAVYRVISRRDRGSSVDIVIEVLGHDD